MENFTTEGWTATVSVNKTSNYFYSSSETLSYDLYDNDNDKLNLFCYKHVYFYQWYFKVYGELAQME